jgi:hypothetical protein
LLPRVGDALLEVLHDRVEERPRLVEVLGPQRGGMAWAFTRYSSDYVEQESEAIGARLGVHAHDAEKAWDWRRR